MNTEEPTVFIVDDDPIICDAVTWLLNSVKIKVETYNNGQAYLDVYDANRYGCLLLDIRMPQMGGFELLNELNNRQNPLPIIFITGHGDVPMAVRAMQEGATDFILKPFNDQLLLEKIQNALTLAKVRDQQIQHEAIDPSIAERLKQLTARETKVLSLIIAGKMNKQVAAELKISDSTVEFHRANVMRKLQVRSVAELVTQYGSSQIK